MNESLTARVRRIGPRVSSLHGASPRNVRLEIASDVEHVPTFYRSSLHSDTSDNLLSIADENVKPHHLLDQGIEGIDYDPVQNEIFINEIARISTSSNRYCTGVLRHLVLFLIGFSTGLAASLIDFSIEHISRVKYQLICWMINRYSSGLLISVPGFIWLIINSALISVAALLVVFFAPVAAGSGIPQVKCYLNGLNIPLVMRCLTMVVKGVGVVLAVSGGLAVGKEGPMIHIGSVIAAGISQGRLRFCSFSLNALRVFRNDQEKRDFVSAGAAAGVAAAFGAPVGGLLFAVEEGASFVYQRLTWMIVSSVI